MTPTAAFGLVHSTVASTPTSAQGLVSRRPTSLLPRECSIIAPHSPGYVTSQTAKKGREFPGLDAHLTWKPRLAAAAFNAALLRAMTGVVVWA
jgi:hypothetical protein